MPEEPPPFEKFEGGPKKNSMGAIRILGGPCRTMSRKANIPPLLCGTAKLQLLSIIPVTSPAIKYTKVTKKT